LDNFEWQFGYNQKFGRLAVDFKDEKLTRTLKPLAEVYADICRNNSLQL
jgi:beta-glucosidase/6-phospho-beta-glucosidase/beta-galactosidase